MSNSLILDEHLNNLLPLQDYVKRALATKTPDNDILSLKEEVLLAKAAIAPHIHAVNSMQSVYSGLLKEASGENTKEINTALFILKNTSNDLHEALKKVAFIVKAATEIEAVKSTRLDALNWLRIIRSPDP